MRFDVWREDFGQTRENARQIKAYDARTAAEEVSRLKFSDWDYPSEIDVEVAEVGSDVVHRFLVEVEPRPHFVARPKAAARPTYGTTKAGA